MNETVIVPAVTLEVLAVQLARSLQRGLIQDTRLYATAPEDPYSSGHPDMHIYLGTKDEVQTHAILANIAIGQRELAQQTMESFLQSNEFGMDRLGLVSNSYGYFIPANVTLLFAAQALGKTEVADKIANALISWPRREDGMLRINAHATGDVPLSHKNAGSLEHQYMIATALNGVGYTQEAHGLFFRTIAADAGTHPAPLSLLWRTLAFQSMGKEFQEYARNAAPAILKSGYIDPKNQLFTNTDRSYYPAEWQALGMRVLASLGLREQAMDTLKSALRINPVTGWFNRDRLNSDGSLRFPYSTADKANLLFALKCISEPRTLELILPAYSSSSEQRMESKVAA